MPQALETETREPTISIQSMGKQVVDFCQVEGRVGEDEKNSVGMNYSLYLQVTVLCFVNHPVFRKTPWVGPVIQVEQVNKLTITGAKQLAPSHTCR